MKINLSQRPDNRAVLCIGRHGGPAHVVLYAVAVTATCHSGSMATEAQWIFIMRHGKAIKPDTLTTFRLHAEGIDSATEVGGALAEVLDDLRKAGTPVDLVRVLHEKSPACSAIVLTLSDAYHRTRRALQNAQGNPPPALPPSELLEGPVSPYKNTPKTWVKEIKGKLAEHVVVTDGHEGAVLIVGHDPGMNWLLQSLMEGSRLWRRRWLTSMVPGLDRAELIALCRCRGGWTPHWALTPTAGTKEALAEITGKIRSKMDTAKVLGGFFTALLTFAATQSVPDAARRRISPVSDDNLLV
jgi:phosphohistidine phosphatase SixA